MKGQRATARKSDVSWDDFPYRKDEQGRPLCRKCEKQLTGRQRAWCSAACVKAIRLMTDWTYIRRIILRRDKYTCVLCQGKATEVDHIIELADGGSFWQQTNLRSLCGGCHKAKTAAARAARAQRKREEKAA